MQNCRSDDAELVSIAGFGCAHDYVCAGLAENVQVCVFVRETCVYLRELARACAEVWFRVA